MVEQFPQFGIGCCRGVLTNRSQQCTIRVSLVSDQITQHLEHARDILAAATTARPEHDRLRPGFTGRLTSTISMAISALLSAVHALTLALGLGAVVARGRALAGPLDEPGWRRLLAADNLWGLAALLWITSGLARVFFGGKTPAFYWRNGAFWLKLGLFAVVFVLEMGPMTAFMGVRQARRTRSTMPLVAVERLRRINHAEIVLVVAIVFVAAFMARGAWLF